MKVIEHVVCASTSTPSEFDAEPNPPEHRDRHRWIREENLFLFQEFEDVHAAPFPVEDVKRREKTNFYDANCARTPATARTGVVSSDSQHVPLHDPCVISARIEDPLPKSLPAPSRDALHAEGRRSAPRGLRHLTPHFLAYSTKIFKARGVALMQPAVLAPPLASKGTPAEAPVCL